MKDMLREKIESTLQILVGKHNWPNDLDLTNFVLEEPRDPSFGHLATNAAMTLSKAVGLKPRDLAALIVAQLKDDEGYIESKDIAGPGFINFRLSLKWWADVLKKIRALGADYGRRAKTNRKVQLEFVSANPTGPLHVGHGRGAALGDALARIFSFLGDDVSREYYINDAGRQMRILGLSVLFRLKELLGRQVQAPSDYYKGDYIIDLASEFLKRLSKDFINLPEEEQIEQLSKLAGDKILDGIKKDLSDFRVEFDQWYPESSLHEKGLVEAAFKQLDKAGHLYDQDGALWFKSSDLGDDKNRVLVKSDGERTYFAADIAYHKDKFDRGFVKLVDVWGADHHGYMPRMKAVVQALGWEADQLSIVLVQLVNLLRDGQLVNMSTRSGEFVTLREVLDEVGADAARFIFLTRSHDSALDFDLELAKAKTRDNPVFYVQYVCARISSLTAKAGIIEKDVDYNLLSEKEELEIIKHLALFKETLESAARRLEPHLLTVYLSSLAKLFHQYYAVHRLVEETNAALTAARVTLAATVRQVTAIGLDLLGVSAPEKM
ncbi:MAG: arginine--tRNA ligase [Deltaproteobacteria bacterium]|jgi:arginyl-tRNA synthetase|nr:arginine--tRNA ligase [Deltaproteobacteria bacterium]